MKINNLFTISYLFIGLAEFAFITPLSHRFISFEEVESHKKLTNVSLIEELHVNSRAQCSQRCVTNPQCKSFNMCYRTACQLNVEDRFSKGVDLIILSDCLYVGMKREFVPQCNENGIQISIAERSSRGLCDLSQKTAISEFGEWQTVTKLINLTVIRKEVRICYGGHTANLVCNDDEVVLIDQIVMVKEVLNYHTALDYCQNIFNGQLWGDIDEPPQRVRETKRLLGDGIVNLGIEDWRSEGTFYNLRGKDVTEYLQLLNALIDNHKHIDHRLCALGDGDKFGIKDVAYWAKYRFACQQVFSQVGPWEQTGTVLVDNATQNSVRETRTCVNGTLGQPRGCAGAKERTFTYFWIRHNYLNFTEARENCHNMSAKLFDYFDGTAELLAFLLRNMLPAQIFWVGVRMSDNWDMWISEDEQSLDTYGRVRLSAHTSTAEQDKYFLIKYKGYIEGKLPPLWIFFRENGTETLPSVCYQIVNTDYF